MNILAFDTSSGICSVAIQYNDQNNDQIKSLSQPAKMQQGQLILSMIKDLLEQCCLTLNELDAIAFGCGPGSFTGVRIASSVAQGLSFALSLPVISISSMQALAETVYLIHQYQSVLVTLDARSEQVYWAFYQVESGHMTLLGEEKLCSPDKIILPNELTHEDSTSEHSCYRFYAGVGDAWAKYQDKFITTLGFVPPFIQSSLTPTAESILSLAKKKIINNEWTPLAKALPVYLR